MIIKLYAHKIEHQSNNGSFVWGYNNLIKSKPKQVIKNNLKSNIE